MEGITISERTHEESGIGFQDQLSILHCVEAGTESDGMVVGS